MTQQASPETGRSIQEIIKSRAEVAQRSKAATILIVISVFLIFAGVGWAMWFFGGKNAALMAQGAGEVIAVVEQTETERVFSNNGTKYHYYAHLSFVDAQGVAHLVRKSVEGWELQKMYRGQSLPLRYAVADPTVVELHAGDLQSASDWGYWLMMGGLAGIGLTVVVALFANRRRPNII